MKGTRGYERADELRMPSAVLAEEAGLSISTIYRLDHRIVETPRLKTVMLLAQAVGMDIELVAHSLKRRKVA